MTQIKHGDPGAVERTPELRKRMWIARVHPLAVHKDILDDRLAKPKAAPFEVAQLQEISRAEMGAFIGRRLGGPPYSRETIGNWEDINLSKAHEYSRADRATITAWAEATGYPEEWLLCETDVLPVPGWAQDHRDALVAEVEELRARVNELQMRLAEAERVAGREAAELLGKLEGLFGGVGGPSRGSPHSARLYRTDSSGDTTVRASVLAKRLLLPEGVSPALVQNL